MKTKRIDILNIGLIVLSLIIATKLPFRLFLFSYAVLGPLHYLTEISWLHEKNYFIKSNKNWAAVLIVAAALVAVYPVFKFIDWGLSTPFRDMLIAINAQTSLLLLGGLLFSASLIFFKKAKLLIATLLLVGLITYLSSIYLSGILIFIGIFLPTLVHVYFFTMLFIFYGAIKSQSKYGFYLGIILLIVPLVIAYMPIELTRYKPSQDTIDAFLNTNLQSVSSAVAGFFGGLVKGQFYALSEIGIRIQIFISFAYTYHYLNWFSKTSIIGWRKTMSQKRFILILAIWAGSVALYVYDYKTGLIALFFLSFVHVFLEFPLNVISIKEIFMLVKRKFIS